MKIKLYKGLSISLAILLIFSFTVGSFIYYIIYEFIYPEKNYSLPYMNYVVENLRSIFHYLDRIIIGIWLFAIAEKLKQDKWSWLLIGLVYSEFAVILLLIVVIFQNIKSEEDLFASTRNLLILLLIALIFKSIARELVLYLPSITNHRVESLKHFGINMGYLKFMYLFVYIIYFILNTLFAFRLSNRLKDQNIRNKKIWVISTVLFGLLPLILFEGMEINKRKKINAA